MRLERYRPTPMGTIIIINLVGLWAMFHVWTRHTAIELGYAISKTQREYEELVTESSKVSSTALSGRGRRPSRAASSASTSTKCQPSCRRKDKCWTSSLSEIE